MPLLLWLCFAVVDRDPLGKRIKEALQGFLSETEKSTGHWSLSLLTKPRHSRSFGLG
jgi:hypothetical protein